MCSVMGQDPTVALKSDRGEYLVGLDDGLTEETVSQDYCFDYITDNKVEDFVQEFPLDDVNLYLHMTGRRSPDYLKEQANFGSEGLVVESDWANISGLPTTSTTGRLAQVQETHIPAQALEDALPRHPCCPR